MNTRCGGRRTSPRGTAAQHQSRAPGLAIEPPHVSSATPALSSSQLLGCVVELSLFSFEVLNVKNHGSLLYLIFVFFLFSFFRIL